MMAPTLTRGARRASDQSLWHNMPVGPVEELLLHMVIQTGPWRLWWMLIVEDELGGSVLSCLQEAHYLAIIGGLPILRLFTAYFRQQTVGHHLRLKVGR